MDKIIMPIYYRPKSKFKIIPFEHVNHMISLAKRPRMRVILALVWLTGARISEILELRKRDIDFEGNTIRIRLKTKKIRDEPMRELYFDIETTPFIQNVKDYVNSKDNRLFKIGVRRAEQLLKEINEETGYWYTFHEFRHSRLTFLARNLRASVSEMMDWTGWKSSSQVGTYIIRGAPKRFKDKIR